MLEKLLIVIIFLHINFLILAVLLIRRILFDVNDFKEMLMLYTVPEYGEDDYNDSGINEEVLKRESAFDERIAQMMEELNLGAEAFIHEPTVSDVLDPSVYNIPHQEVNLYDNEEMEVSE